MELANDEKGLCPSGMGGAKPIYESALSILLFEQEARNLR